MVNDFSVLVRETHEMREVLKALKPMEVGYLKSMNSAIDLLPERAPLARIVIGFMNMGSLRAVEGAVRVMDGDAGGWGDLGESCYWKTWRLKAQEWLVRTGNGRGLPANVRDLALCYLHGVTLGLEQVVAWCASTLRGRFDQGGLTGREAYPLAALTLALASGADNPELGFLEDELGAYADAVSSLRSGVGIDAAIRGMVEYHSARTVDRNDDVLLMEFEECPYPLFAVEILAFLKACESRGLALPTVDYDLLGLPLNNPARRPVEISGDAMRLAALVERAIPGLDLTHPNILS